MTTDFIDLTKAFDTVNRELLWQILRKFCCPPAFLTILQEFPSGMKAKVTVGDRHVCKQYADDAAIRAHSAADLQSNLDGSL